MKVSLMRIYGAVIKAEQYFSRTLLVVIIFLTFMAAMSRTFDFPLPWSLDLTLLLFAWFAFLASTQAARRNAHMGVDILVKYLPGKVRGIIDVFNKALMLAFLIYIGYNAAALAIVNRKQQIDSLYISYSFITFSLVTGCLLMGIGIAIQMAQRIMVLSGKAAEEDFAYREESPDFLSDQSAGEIGGTREEKQ
jgi:TRAP-type C4-dicarboxylate transport system permease small subunit